VTSAPGGVRERSKARRRDAIQRAALRLFAERGYDGTTLPDIAAAAEVAPRTVSMYFATKADLALAASEAIAARLTAQFEAGGDAGFVTVIGRWLADEAEHADPELAVLTNAMLAANPALQALSSAPIRRAMQVGADSLYAAVNRRRDDPMASIVAASVAAAIFEYQSVSGRAGSTPELRQQLLRYLRALVRAARAS
jgi:AcrR family transcriptional regulator